MANQQPIQSGYVQAPLLRFHRDNPLRLTVTVDDSFPLTTMDVRFALQPKGMPIRKQWIAGEAGASLTVAGQVITLLAEPDSASDTDANFDLSDIQALGSASWELSIRGDISNVPKGIVIVGDMEWIAIGAEGESGPNAAISNPDITLDIVDEELTLTITGGGVDGREVELRINAGRLEWRYVGEATWIDLGAVVGPAGADGADGAPGPNEITTATDTAITGILKGAAGRVEQAVAGTDYVAPSALSAFGAQLVDDADAAAARTTLGGGATGQSVFTAATVSQARSALDETIIIATGTDTRVATVYADDSEAKTGTLAPGTYLIRAHIPFSNSGGSQIAWRITFSGTADAALPIGFYNQSSATGELQLAVGYTSSNAEVMISIYAKLNVTAGGVLAFNFRNNNATGTVTRKANAVLIYQKIA